MEHMPETSGNPARRGGRLTTAVFVRAVRRAPRAVRRNWRLKLAALGLAVLLWAFVRAGEGG